VSANPPLWSQSCYALKPGTIFSQYKLKTIHRRIERRMAVHQIASLDALDNVIEGAVIAFVDISREKKAHEMLRRSGRKNRGMRERVPDSECRTATEPATTLDTLAHGAHTQDGG
jgi:hypothetical protein